MTQQPPPPPPYGEEPPGDQPYGAPYQPYAAPQQPVYGYGYGVNHGGAVTSLVLGITSIAVAILGACMCLFVGALGALVGPFGIWQAVRAKREIDAAPAQYVNRGTAVAGLATSIVGTALGGLVLLASVVLLAFFGFALQDASTVQ